MLQWNIRSLPARCLSVQHLLASSKCFVVIISETWLSPSRNFHIPHFNIFRANRHDGYGGVAIEVHSSLKVRSIEINLNLKLAFSTYKIDIVGIEVLNIQNFPSISFWSCYIPDDSLISPEILNSLFQLGTKNFLICGDFNAHYQAWGFSYSSRRRNLIYETINFLGLGVLYSGTVTHLGRPNCPDSAIDIYFSSPDLYWLITWHTLTEPHGNDHFPIIISLNSVNHSHLNPQNSHSTLSPFAQFNLNKADWELFFQTIK
jgi:exonuclease III